MPGIKHPRKKQIVLAEDLWGMPASATHAHHEELLTTAEAAALTKLSEAWFVRKRWEGRGPPYRKRGRLVRYLKSELLAWFTDLQSSDFSGRS